MIKDILIVDDHPIICDGLSQILKRENDMAVSASSSNLQETLDILANQRIDFIILDLMFRNGDSGFIILEKLMELHPDIPVLILSMHDEPFYAEKALKMGARGYLTKQELTDTVVSAIRTIDEGKLFVSDYIKDQMIHTIVEEIESPLETTEILTSREMEIFLLLAEGLGSQEIGRKLNIGQKTVDTHRQRIKKKLNMTSSSQVMKFAIDWKRQYSIHMKRKEKAHSKKQ